MTKKHKLINNLDFTHPVYYVEGIYANFICSKILDELE